MSKVVNISHKSNGQVFPSETDRMDLPGVIPAEEEIENTNIQVPVFYGDAGPENNFVQKSALHPLFNVHGETEDDDAESSKKEKKTKTDGRKLKTFEIVSDMVRV